MDEYLSLSEQLKILFDARRHETGRIYTLQEVSTETGVSMATISHMRSGRIQNPQLSTLREIAHFFRVPLRYFETRTVEECYALLEAGVTRPAAVSEIAFRASSLTPEAQRDILTIIRWIQVAEQQRKLGLDVPPLPHLSHDDESDDQPEDQP